MRSNYDETERAVLTHGQDAAMTGGTTELSIAWTGPRESARVPVMSHFYAYTLTHWRVELGAALLVVGSVLALGSGLSVIPVSFALTRLAPPALLGARWILGTLAGYAVLSASLIVSGLFYVKIDWTAPWLYLVAISMVGLMMFGPSRVRAFGQGENEGSERA